MSARQALLARVTVFDDSAEIAAMLRGEAPDYGKPGGYIMREAADHIDGMWALVREMAKELRRGNA